MKTKAILLMVFFLGWVTTGWAADHVKGDGKLTRKRFLSPIITRLRWMA